MNGHEFWRRIDADPQFAILGVRESPDEIFIEHLARGVKYAISIKAILDAGWTDLYGVLTGAREARVLTHVSRICGYYALLHNWNRSKLAERRDRERGDYAVPEIRRAG